MKDVIQQKLDRYQCTSTEDEENAIKEITQEVILYGLAKNGFFKHACFQGGTCLRIIHGLNRFSEDLDFSLNSPDPSFDIESYLLKTAETISAYGYKIEFSDNDKAASSLRMLFLKDDSIKKGNPPKSND